MHIITCVQDWKEGLSRDPPVAFVTGRTVFQAEAGDENPQVWSLDGGVSIVWKCEKCRISGLIPDLLSLDLNILSREC